MTELSSMALECALHHRNNKTMTNGAQMLKSSCRETTLLQQWKGKQMVSVNFNEVISVHTSACRKKKNIFSTDFLIGGFKSRIDILVKFEKQVV